MAKRENRRPRPGFGTVKRHPSGKRTALRPRKKEKPVSEGDRRVLELLASIAQAAEAVLPPEARARRQKERDAAARRSSHRARPGTDTAEAGGMGSADMEPPPGHNPASGGRGQRAKKKKEKKRMERRVGSRREPEDSRSGRERQPGAEHRKAADRRRSKRREKAASGKEESRLAADALSSSNFQKAVREEFLRRVPGGRKKKGKKGGERAKDAVAVEPEVPYNPDLFQWPEPLPESELSTEPVESAEPETPAEPTISAEPEVPLEQAPSAEPVESVEPEAPAEPETPAEPEIPAEPETPAEQEIPTESEAPAEPEIPTEPEAPSAEPVESVEPKAPAELETPAEQEIPTESEKPAELEAPAEQEIPAESKAPAEPEEPTVPKTPAEPEEPAELKIPAEPKTPAEPEAPAEPKAPAEPDATLRRLPPEQESEEAQEPSQPPEPTPLEPVVYHPRPLRRRRFRIPWRKVHGAILRWALFYGICLLFGFAVTAATESVRAGGFGPVWNWAAGNPGSFILTILIYGGCTALLGAAAGWLWPAGAVVSITALAAVLVDYFKTAINGTPLVLADFGLAGQAQQVAGVAGNLHPPGSIWLAALILLASVGLLFLSAPLTKPRSVSARVGWSLSSLLICVLLFNSSAAYGIGAALNLRMDNVQDPFASHNRYGLAVSLWREFFQREKEVPKCYGPEFMEEAVQELDELLLAEPVRPSLSRPNVIIVLSESFFDLTRLPNVTFQRDPVANYHALQKESISGRFFSHYLGYGTGYIELSMHTGWALPDLLPGQNICFLDPETYELLDSLTEQYTKSGGYQARMLHAYDDSLYNRTVTYPLFGYEKSLYSKDIQAIDMEHASPFVYGGYYMRDGYLYEALLHEMEEINAAGDRAFLYAITMENHQPFNPDKFDTDPRRSDFQIKAESDRLTEEEMAVFKVGQEGVTRADHALGQLVDALRKSPEPTLLVFYGDHRPTLPMPDGETVYTKLGASPGNDTSLWTEKQFQDVYSSDYLIWANDAALLHGQAGTVKPSGVLALGPDVLELTDQRVSRYWGLMKLVSRAELARTWAYYVDGEGTLRFSIDEIALTPAQRKILDLRDTVIYDALYGKRYVTASMNDPPGTPLPKIAEER